MTLSLDTHTMLASPTLGASMPAELGSPRTAMGSSIHGRLHKHRRRTSNSSTGSTNSPAVTQFPVFDTTYETGTTFVANSTPDPKPLFKQIRQDSSSGQKESSSFSKKMKPLVSYAAARDKKTLDLNLSKAENEERGIYITDSPPTTGDAQKRNFFAAGHVRTMSGASQISSSSAHSAHRVNTTYMHPARQMPHSPTPPMHSVPFEMPGVLRPTSSHSSIANVPALPPPSHYRSSNLSNLSALNTQATTPTNSSAPAQIPSAPATARSSIDSAFRDRISFAGSRRSRRPSRSKEPMGIEEEQLFILRQRADFDARQEKLNEKYRLQDEKKQRQEERRRRKSEATETLKSKREIPRRRGDSAGTVETIGTLDSDMNSNGVMGVKIGKIASRGTHRTTADTQRPSVEQLSAIGYASTTELGRPQMGYRSATEEEMKIPKRQKTQGAGSAGKAVQSRWTLFWFQMKTMMLKMFRSKK